MRFLRQWDAENIFIHFFWEGLNSMQSLIPFPILPQPKQKIDNYSYLKEIHDLELLSRETKMPPRDLVVPLFGITTTLLHSKLQQLLFHKISSMHFFLSGPFPSPFLVSVGHLPLVLL
ncbi:hypothetical protein V6Z12_A09G073400 [Gossypium hirsutum]